MSEVYTPTKSQATAVDLLETLSVAARWRVDVVALDSVAYERCADDSDHGWATVCGAGVELDEFCPWCAARYVELAHRDPHWSGDLIELHVLREPGERS